MKRKILACVLACATLFLGMGYAFWTDSLQITTTADTGKLEVKFVDLDAFGTYGDEDGWAVYTGAPDGKSVAASFFLDGSYNELATADELADYQADIAKFTKTSFSAVQVNSVDLEDLDGYDGTVDNAYQTGTATSDKISVSLTDMYPGYAQLFRTDILNTGTLAAKLADIELVFDEGTDDSVKDMIGVSLDVIYDNGPEVAVLDSKDTFTIDGVEFVRLSALDDIKISDEDNLLYIYPDDNNTMDAIFGVAMDPDYAGVRTTGHIDADKHAAVSTHADADSQLQDANFTLNFLWDQFNTENPNGDATTPE